MSVNPDDYIVNATDVEVSDIDLDTVEFGVRDGRRLSEELAEQLANEGHCCCKTTQSDSWWQITVEGWVTLADRAI